MLTYMKKYIVVGLLLSSFILSPVFVSAQTSQPDQIATLICLLQSLVQLLQQQLSMLQGQNPVTQTLSPQQRVDILQQLNNSTTTTQTGGVFESVQFNLPSCGSKSGSLQYNIFTMPGGSYNTFPSGGCVGYSLGSSAVARNNINGVAAVYVNYGASATSLYLVLVQNLNSQNPKQVDFVDVRSHSSLEPENLFRVGVKDININENGIVSVTALVVPKELENSAGYLQSATKPVVIKYQIVGNKLISLGPLG